MHGFMDEGLRLMDDLQAPLPSTEQLARFIDAEDPIAIVKRGHGMLCAVMAHLVYAYIPRPNASIWKMKFDRLVALCDALGVVTTNEYAYLRYIDRVRNESDHDGAEIGPSHEAAAYDLIAACIDPEHAQRNAADRQALTDNGKYFPTPLANTFVAMYTLLYERQAHISSNNLRVPDRASQFVNDRARSGAVSAAVAHLILKSKDSTLIVLWAVVNVIWAILSSFGAKATGEGARVPTQDALSAITESALPRPDEPA